MATENHYIVPNVGSFLEEQNNYILRMEVSLMGNNKVQVCAEWKILMLQHNFLYPTGHLHDIIPEYLEINQKKLLEKPDKNDKTVTLKLYLLKDGLDNKYEGIFLASIRKVRSFSPKLMK